MALTGPTGADATAFSLPGASFSGGSFSGASLSDASFPEAAFSGTSFFGVSACAGSLSSVAFSAASFRDAPSSFCERGVEAPPRWSPSTWPRVSPALSAGSGAVVSVVWISCAAR
ncbi:MAG: pentapeptide repeat-containing protein [Rubrobacter sp.]|nr:pentapeptide repeat-containing protein [Rubrobacteraceae bacterium]MBA3793791.1 pentapeptide repeat-containing protein [Rubrobacter sp.]